MSRAVPLEFQFGQNYLLGSIISTARWVDGPLNHADESGQLGGQSKYIENARSCNALLNSHDVFYVRLMITVPRIPAVAVSSKIVLESG